MSWFAKSLATSLNLHDDDDDEDDEDQDDNSIHINVEDSESPPPPPPHSNGHNHEQSPSLSSPFSEIALRGVKKDPSEITETLTQRIDSSSSSSSSENVSRGVKEDLSEITETLTRQFWGVASFLAPPPPSSSSTSILPQDDDSIGPDVAGIDGIRSDFAEIGGRFKSGISKLSSNVAVTEITKIALNLLQLGSEEQGSLEDFAVADLEVVGVTEELISFVRNIAMYPGTWLDLPLPDHEDSDDFDMSNVQQEHAWAVEHRAPGLADLRIQLCPEYMNEAHFWTIYFVLVHSKLNKHDAELLSSPQIVEARRMLQQVLQNESMANPEPEWSRSTSHLKETTDSANEEHLSVPSNAQFESVPPKTSELESTSCTVAADFVKEKHPIPKTERQTIDKSVIDEEPTSGTKHQNSSSSSLSRTLDEKYEDDGDAWLKEEDEGDVPASNKGVGTSTLTIPTENEEDVSFSDLEDDDDGDMPASSRKTTYVSDSLTKDTHDRVHSSTSSVPSDASTNPVSMKVLGSEQANAHQPEAGESNDWLDVGDINKLILLPGVMSLGKY